MWLSKQRHKALRCGSDKQHKDVFNMQGHATVMKTSTLVKYRDMASSSTHEKKGFEIQTWDIHTLLIRGYC